MTSLPRTVLFSRILILSLILQSFDCQTDFTQYETGCLVTDTGELKTYCHQFTSPQQNGTDSGNNLPSCPGWKHIPDGEHVFSPVEDSEGDGYMQITFPPANTTHHTISGAYLQSPLITPAEITAYELTFVYKLDSITECKYPVLKPNQDSYCIDITLWERNRVFRLHYHPADHYVGNWVYNGLCFYTANEFFLRLYAVGSSQGHISRKIALREVSVYTRNCSGNCSSTSDTSTTSTITKTSTTSATTTTLSTTTRNTADELTTEHLELYLHDIANLTAVLIEGPNKAKEIMELYQVRPTMFTKVDLERIREIVFNFATANSTLRSNTNMTAQTENILDIIDSLHCLDKHGRFIDREFKVNNSDESMFETSALLQFAMKQLHKWLPHSCKPCVLRRRFTTLLSYSIRFNSANDYDSKPFPSSSMSARLNESLETHDEFPIYFEHSHLLQLSNSTLRKYFDQHKVRPVIFNRLSRRLTSCFLKFHC